MAGFIVNISFETAWCRKDDTKKALHAYKFSPPRHYKYARALVGILEFSSVINNYFATS